MSKHLELENIESCGLPQALEIVGERWSFMILRAAFNGIRHFEDFLNVLGIARNILSTRLANLVENGIMVREPCAHDRRKVEYCLTSKGEDLLRNPDVQEFYLGLGHGGEKRSYHDVKHYRRRKRWLG